jgi:hypothetical protein
MNIAHSDPPKILTIIPLACRAHSTEAGCRNLGRDILRHFDAGGRAMDNAEFCNAHARVRIERYGLLGLGFTPIARLLALETGIVASDTTCKLRAHFLSHLRRRALHMFDLSLAFLSHIV